MKNIYITVALLFFYLISYSQCYTKVSSKVFHNLTIRTDGTLWAWGQNENDQIGDNSGNNQPSPIQIGTDNSWTSVSAGTQYSLAIKSDGTLWAWGSNSYGQTGNGGADIPEMVGEDTDWILAEAGLSFSAAIKSDGTLWMWGANFYGQLGNNSTTNLNTPTQVGEDTNWVAVSLGAQHTLALKSDGTLWAWGLNSYGQLGIGLMGNQHVPIQIGTDNDWIAIEAGYSASYAIKGNGTLWGWGSNGFGQVGNASSSDQIFPIQIGANTWQHIESTNHCLAIRSDGTLWSWGRNVAGEVWNVTPGVNQSSPVQVGTDNNWTQAVTGFYHSIALKNNGTLYSWGDNEFGTLGNDSFVDSLTLIQIGTTCTEIICNINTPSLSPLVTECSLEFDDIVIPTTTNSCGGTVTASLHLGAFPLTETGTIVWKFGNEADAIFVEQEVIIQDTELPVPSQETLSTITASCSITSEQISIPTAIDSCAGEITATTSNSLNFDEQGSYTIIWSYDDGNGNITTQSQQVLIEDSEMPVPTLENLPTLSSQCELSENDIEHPTALDNCAGVVIATTEDSLEFSDQGTYTINWIYNDGNGNITTQQQSVIINDTQAPVPTLETLPSISGECSLSNNDITYPTALDNCAGVVIATTEDSLEFSDQGTYTIIWIYSDGNGNNFTQQQQVVIEDTQAPVPAINTLPDLISECGLTSEEIQTPTAIDDCEGETIATTNNSLNFSEQGNYTILWTFEDSNGNSIDQEQQIIIEDVTSPTVITQDITVDLNGAASITITSEEINNGSYDNCNIESIEININNFTQPGIYEVVLTVYDNAGNESSDIATVTVVDSSLNINDFTKGDISIYPIPARDFITIKKPEDILILSTDFYDMLGKKLFNIEGNIDRIDTSFLSASSYFIIIHTDKGVLKKNLIIK
ncbi:RCC1 domain-containing protein [Flavobacterium alkalisoli]